MLRTLLYLLLISTLAILTGSWGSTGHRKISNDSSLSFNQQMQDFHTWTAFLADHASDADDRKDQDPNESPKHYIDIDSYLSFLLLGRIPQTFDSVIASYGSSFVYGNGILPWATQATFEALQRSFEVSDFESAKIHAADLGHYVGDGHMPLHITQNYNGQLTGNDDIHSHYESSMVNTYINDIIYNGDSIYVIPDVNAYIFDYLYANYRYIDSILIADNWAQNIAGNNNSQEYRQALWDKTGNFTILLMKRASHSLTELIFTAWVNAGSPSLPAFSINEPSAFLSGSISSISQNPFSSSTRIRYILSENTRFQLMVNDITGKQVATLVDTFAIAGSYETDWKTLNLPEGVYLLSLKTPKSRQVKKLVHLN